MNISLSAQWQRFVAAKVRKGRYQSASEVVREGLRLLEEREQQRKAVLADFRKQIQIGIDALDRGEGLDADVAFDRLLGTSRTRRSQRR